MRSRKKSKETLRQMKMKTQLIPNLWVTAKAILRGKVIAIQAYLKKQEKSQIINLALTPKGTRKRTEGRKQ